MAQRVQNQTDAAKLAQAAQRNLPIDCEAGEPARRFSSRLLHLGAEGLHIAAPVFDGGPVNLDVGEQVTGTFRLGQELLQFSAVVEGATRFQLNPQTLVPATLLRPAEELSVMQRRRYYRVDLQERDPATGTLWELELSDDGEVIVSGEFCGEVADVSAGGLALLVADRGILESGKKWQLWVRFVLPDQAENLIFRVRYCHARWIQALRRYHVGLEILEYIDPSSHSDVIEDIAKFVAVRQRIESRRRKDR